MCDFFRKKWSLFKGGGLPLKIRKIITTRGKGALFLQKESAKKTAIFGTKTLFFIQKHNYWPCNLFLALFGPF